MELSERQLAREWSKRTGEPEEAVRAALRRSQVPGVVAARRAMRSKWDYGKARVWLRQQKDRECVDCGGKFPSECMDFHHRDSMQKKGTISAMVRQGYAKKTIEEEIAKCDLLCANCHRVKTNARRRKQRAIKKASCT